MKLYLSGPISNDPDFRLHFKEAEIYFKKLNYQVVNPVDVGDELFAANKNPSYKDFMIADIGKLFECDGIVMLPGWKNSKGALAENALAVSLNYKVIEFYKTKL